MTVGTKLEVYRGHADKTPGGLEKKRHCVSTMVDISLKRKWLKVKKLLKL